LPCLFFLFGDGGKKNFTAEIAEIPRLFFLNV